MLFPWALWLCRAVQTSAAVLLAGTVTLRLLARGTELGGEGRAWRGWAGGSWGVLLVAGVWQFPLTAASMSGLPLAEACSSRVLADVIGGTRFGAVWQVQAGLLAGIGSLLAGGRCVAQRMAAQLEHFQASHRHQSAGQDAQHGGRDAHPTRENCGHDFPEKALDLILALLSAAFLTTLIWAGHAHASSRSAWLLPAGAWHVVAAGAWPGGLLPLGWLLILARRDPVLIPATITITRRFSRVSVVAVGILAGSGLLNSCGLVGTFPALWSSSYGRLLLGKSAIFACMVCLGALNRRLISPVAAADPAEVVRRLRRNVSWECALAVAVLLATEALAMNAPPAGG